MNASSSNRKAGLTPKEFEPVFREAGILVSELDAARSQRARATLVGNFLSKHVGWEVPIEHDGRTGRAKLCGREARSRMTKYYFEVRWDAPEEDEPTAQTATPAPAVMQAVESSEGTDASSAGSAPTIGDSANSPGGNREQW